MKILTYLSYLMNTKKCGWLRCFFCKAKITNRCERKQTPETVGMKVSEYRCICFKCYSSLKKEDFSVSSLDEILERDLTKRVTKFEHTL